jgi:hypothetical protein
MTDLTTFKKSVSEMESTEELHALLNEIRSNRRTHKSRKKKTTTTQSGVKLSAKEQAATMDKAAITAMLAQMKGE